jgi:hypothetical protein
MQFVAKCAAVVSKNGSMFVLLKFAGHLIGEIPKELGELEYGETYDVTIQKSKRSEG